MPAPPLSPGMLKRAIGTAALAFRGYNVTNLGRTPELLAHPAYGPVVERHLRAASELLQEVIGQPVDLADRVRRREVSCLETYAHDIATIMAVELAQLELLQRFHDIAVADAQFLCGYSLGEASAVVAGGVFPIEAVLRPLLVLAEDCAALAHDVHMGVLFSRGRVLDADAVEKLCVQITAEGRGTIGISTYLSPNTLLLMGQRDTLATFRQRMHEVLPADVHLRANPHRWPPIHTSIVRQKNISNRAAVMLETAPGGFTAPKPPILSCVTGEANYDDINSRSILSCWVDHPQLLWDVIDKLLRRGVETIIHVGPEPNIFPATLDRLSNNVMAQLSGRSLASMGKWAMSRIARKRPWLTQLISDDAALLRAPFVVQVVLEDWLLLHAPNTPHT